MNFAQQVDKNAIFLLFGCFCNNPRLILNEKFKTSEYDFPEPFHKMVWGVLMNIAKKGNVQYVTPLEMENEMMMSESAVSLWKLNDGWNYIDTAKKLTQDKMLNVSKYYDDVRKYSIIRNASENLGIDTTFLYDESDDVKMESFSKMTSENLLNAINEKFISFRDLWRNNFGDNYSFHVGDGIDDLISKFKTQEEVYGYPFQSGYLTTVFRGMRPKKFIIRSSVSGGGKSRSSMSDALNIGTDYIYDWSKMKWISTGEKQSVLFISTELDKEEIQSCLLAHISGIEQDRLEEHWSELTEDELRVISESTQYVKESLMYCEYMPDFTIDSINDCIEQYVINFNIKYCFFDYINESPSLYSYYFQKSQTRLRTDQVLFLFSNALKLTANRFNIFLGSSTQLNDSWKEDNNKDASALKGSKAIIEKADGGILALPVTKRDLSKLEPILSLDGTFADKVPNTAYYIFKNRGGKWKTIIIWTKLNMGTMRECDCFVTTYDFELVTDIERVLIDFQLDDVGEVQYIEDYDMSLDDAIELSNELAVPYKYNEKN